MANIENFWRLFWVVNPIVLLPIFHTARYIRGDKDDIPYILGSIIVAFLILIVSAIFGEDILEIMGISINSFSTAGGVLLSIIGGRMMIGEFFPKEQNVENPDAERKKGDWITPMGIPYIAGPGAITATLIIANNDTSFYIIPKIFTVLIIAFILFITMILLIIPYAIKQLLTESHVGTVKTAFTGIVSNAFSRVSGLLITAIGIEFIRMGITGMLI